MTEMMSSTNVFQLEQQTSPYQIFDLQHLQ